MKPIFRFGAAALTALLLLSGSLASQEQPDDPGDQQTQPVLVEYNIQGLTQSGMTRARVPGAIGDLLAPDRTFGTAVDRELDQWSLRESGREACCWDEPDELMETIASFCAFGDDWETRSADNSSNRCGLVASPEMHKRVKWAFDALQRLNNIKVNVRVHKLAAGAAVDQTVIATKQAAALAANARLVGMANTGLGDPIVLQQTGATTFLSDYEATTATGAAAHMPISGTLITGDEFVAGAIVMADGRVWVQGWHAARNLVSLRKMQTVAGEIELPTSGYRYTPMSAVIENGGAALIDTGASGRFMVSVLASGNVPDLRLDCGDAGELALLNVTGALNGYAMGSRWLMTPNTVASMDDAEFHQVIFEEYVDGPYNDAAITVYERLAENGGARELSVIGPLLGMRSFPLDPEDPDTAAERKRQDNALATMCQVREAVSLRMRTIRVPANSKLAAGLLNGEPSNVDIAELESLADRVSVADRLVCAGLEQNMDLLDTRISAHLHGYSVNSATEVAIHDPEVRSLLLGSQIRWVTREGVDGAVLLEMRAGVTVGSEKFEPIEVTLAGKKFEIERSRSNLVQARFSGELKVGGSISHIVPASGTQDELLVFVVSRIR